MQHARLTHLAANSSRLLVTLCRGLGYSQRRQRASCKAISFLHLLRGGRVDGRLQKQGLERQDAGLKRPAVKVLTDDSAQER